MRIKLLCAIAVAVILGGYASLGPAQPRSTGPKQCPPTACDATITVDASGKISIDYDVLKLSHGDRSPVITWNLDAADTYEFRRDSIQPHTGAPGSGKQTTDQRTWDDQITFQNNNAKRFRVKNANTKPVTLYYNVKVYRTGTSSYVSLDPAVANDP